MKILIQSDHPGWAQGYFIGNGSQVILMFTWRNHCVRPVQAAPPPGLQGSPCVLIMSSICCSWFLSPSSKAKAHLQTSLCCPPDMAVFIVCLALKKKPVIALRAQPVTQDIVPWTICTTMLSPHEVTLAGPRSEWVSDMLAARATLLPQSLDLVRRSHVWPPWGPDTGSALCLLAQLCGFSLQTSKFWPPQPLPFPPAPQMGDACYSYYIWCPQRSMFAILVLYNPEKPFPSLYAHW